MNYINIKGMVGTTNVNLQVEIPIETMLEQLPGVLEAIEKNATPIVTAGVKFKTAMSKLEKKWHKLFA